MNTGGELYLLRRGGVPHPLFVLPECMTQEVSYGPGESPGGCPGV
jgi:hypothetical protein